MMRRVYFLLIRLHPREFHDRFGEEMELIYDEAADSCGAASLVIDAALSLGRQWLIRGAVWKWVAAGVGATIPLIFSFGSFLPWGDMWAVFRACF